MFETDVLTLLDTILSRLDKIERGQSQILSVLSLERKRIMAALDALNSQVAITVGAEQSAIVLLQGLSAALAAAGTDPAKLAALVSELNTSSSALAAAVAANPLPAAAPVSPAPAPATPPAAS